jgi:hypothetical protein
MLSRHCLLTTLAPAVLLAGVILSGLLTACVQTPSDGPLLDLEPRGAPEREWTRAFRQESVLVADEIFIEGPFDLIDHVALRQDAETTLYETRTVPEGLLQELVARPEAGTAVRAQLDAWSLAALRKITILQRPGEVPVTVRARGKAFWSAVDGSGEQRQDELVFQGLPGR